MSRGAGLRSWALWLSSTQIPTLLFSSRTSRSSRVLPFPPRRMIATITGSTCNSLVNGKNKKKQKVIVISGPTGAGKSRLAFDLAKRLNGEIISADSVQVYQGLDIGSAKPTLSDREEVRHHLIDILHPSQDYSVGQFFEDARQATRDIIESGHVPIVAGGTGLYLRWYIYGKPDVPKSSPKVNSEAYSKLLHLKKNGDWDAAVQLVMEAGDSKAQFVATNDWYRLRRSLEIIKSTGSPPSAFTVPYDSFREQLDSRILDPSCDNIFATGGLGENLSKDLDYDFICFFLSSNRVDLYRQIDLRCEEMLLGSQGILSEAKQLLEMGLCPNMNSATRAIGYRQAMEYLLQSREQGGSSSPGEFYAFLSEFQKASRNFAKRQMTWFRNELIYQWLDASQPLEEVLSFVLEAYHGEPGRVVVPESLRMEKDVSSREESLQLKSYRPRNRYFVSREDCSCVLDWIRRTPGKLKSAWS